MPDNKISEVIDGDEIGNNLPENKKTKKTFSFYH